MVVEVVVEAVPVPPVVVEVDDVVEVGLGV